VVGAGIFGAFAALMFARGQTDIAIGCGIGMVLTAGNLVVWRLTRRLDPAMMTLVLVGAAGILWVIACDLGRSSPFFWAPFFVLVPFFLLGHVRGLIAALLFAAPVLALAWQTQADTVMAEHDPVFFVRFALSLGGTVLFAYLFERSRQRSFAEVKLLSGFLPICAHCKKIRDDQGYWKQIEAYIAEHSEAQFSHGLCEGCAVELYGEDILDDA